MELQIQNLTKRYGEKVALDHVSCTLQDGVYGLLGANGAGKSTLMNIITGNVQADQGAVFFNGKNILEPDKEQAFRKCLGYMPQSPVQYRGFTIEDFLYYMAAASRNASKKCQAENRGTFGIVGTDRCKNEEDDGIVRWNETADDAGAGSTCQS